MFKTSEAIICQHCGAPLANHGTKISQCDHCNTHNELNPDTEKEILLARKAKESQNVILEMMNVNPERNFTAQEIIVIVSKDISFEDMYMFSGYVMQNLKDMQDSNVLKCVRGRAGGYQIMK